MKYRNFFVVLLSFFILCIFCTNAMSKQYIYINHGSASCKMSIKNEMVRGGFSSAIIKWNNTNTPVKITAASSIYSNGYNSYCADYYLEDTWYGEYVPLSYNAAGRATRFKIILNSRVLANESSTFWVSVLVHELGHALCLGDNPSTGNASIMNYSRNRNYLSWPTINDEAGVNYAYSQKGDQS